MTPTHFGQSRPSYSTGISPWSAVSETDVAKGAARWFVDAKLNVSVNRIDRHLPERAHDTAIIWEGDDPDDSQSFTYQELKIQVCRFANALRAQGIGKGDRVCIYMPMIPEAAFAMLACARIGAIHSVVFGVLPKHSKIASMTQHAAW